MSAANNTDVIDDAILTPIARSRLDIETLLTRNSDALDFHDVSVWGVKQALRDAYSAGLAASAPLAETLRILMISCEEALSEAWDKSDGGFEDMIELVGRAVANWEGGAK